jgi:hypothetical protein
MTMELEGNLYLERAHTRRWVSIIAVIIPVAAIVLLTAWFVRVYVVPPTIAIPSPMLVVEAPPAPPTVFARAEIAAPQPPMAAPTPAEPPRAIERRETTASSALPMFATLALVPPAVNATSSAVNSTPSAINAASPAVNATPPAVNSAPPAYADPAQDAPPVAPSIIVAEPALESGEPISGPIPLPRAKPHGPLAFVSSAIPLPRPRPVESTPPPEDVPAVDRHAVP